MKIKKKASNKDDSNQQKQNECEQTQEQEQSGRKFASAVDIKKTQESSKSFGESETDSNFFGDEGSGFGQPDLIPISADLNAAKNKKGVKQSQQKYESSTKQLNLSVSTPTLAAVDSDEQGNSAKDQSDTQQEYQWNGFTNWEQDFVVIDENESQSQNSNEQVSGQQSLSSRRDGNGQQQAGYRDDDFLTKSDEIVDFGSEEKTEQASIETLQFQRPSFKRNDDYLLPAEQFDAKTCIENFLGVQLESYADGNNRTLCPRCKGGSTSERSFSVTIEDEGMTVLWNCFRAKCGFSGGKSAIQKDGYRQLPHYDLRLRDPNKPSKYAKPSKEGLQDLTDKFELFFRERKISKQVLKRNNIQMKRNVKCPFRSDLVDAIAFPYYKYTDDGQLEVVNIKYRTLDKVFWQEKDMMPIVYGYQDAIQELVNDSMGKVSFRYQDTIYVVEGEMDKLAMEEAGFTNVISVPSGAPSNPTPLDKDSKKYDFMHSSSEIFKNASKVVLAVDNDAPGIILMDDLSRRIGRGKCCRVQFPISRSDHIDGENLPEGDSGFRKDANDVLMKDGPEVLHKIIQSHIELPLTGVIRFVDRAQDIIRLYLGHSTKANPTSTGWTGLNRFYNVVPGELTVVTGVPNSGKSEWLDALAVNIAANEGWVFAVASLEKDIPTHGQQLLEKYVGKPFFLRNDTTERMNQQEMIGGLQWINHHFILLRSDDILLPSVDWLLEQARDAHLRYGINGLIVDPYNELDHQRNYRQTETEYISLLISKVKNFAQSTGVHVWLVAHPRQQYQWRGEAPTLYEIAGSAHFVNKMDIGIVVHRYPKYKNKDLKQTTPRNAQLDQFSKLLQEDDRNVLIRVMKVRNKFAGQQGDYILQYNRVNGRYADIYQDSLDPQSGGKEYVFPTAMQSEHMDNAQMDSDEQIPEPHEQYIDIDTVERNVDDIEHRSYLQTEPMYDTNQIIVDTNSDKAEEVEQRAELSQNGDQAPQKVAKQQFLSEVGIEKDDDKKQNMFYTSHGPVDSDQVLQDLWQSDDEAEVDNRGEDFMDQQDKFDADFLDNSNW